MINEMELLELLKNRRSVRKYTDEHISNEALEKILQAGLLAPAGRGIKHVEFAVTRDKKALESLSKVKAGGAGMLKAADAAIAVAGDTEKSITWIEDCSIAMTLMQLEASAQSVGSCWVQCRGRQNAEGADTEALIRAMFDIPERYGVLAVLSLGMPDECPEPRELPEVKASNRVRG